MSRYCPRIFISTPIFRAAQRVLSCRRMATDRSQLPHEDRTAAEPRQDKLNDVVLHEIQQVNNSIRLYTLRIKDREKGIKV